MSTASTTVGGIKTNQDSSGKTSTYGAAQSSIMKFDTTTVATMDINGLNLSDLTLDTPLAPGEGGTGITAPGANGNLLTSDGAGNWTSAAPSAGGSVTSVAATVPSHLSISGSPITSSGTLAIGLSGTALPAANGGTSLTTSSSINSVLLGDASNGWRVSGGINEGNANRVLISQASGKPLWGFDYPTRNIGDWTVAFTMASQTSAGTYTETGDYYYVFMRESLTSINLDRVVTVYIYIDVTTYPPGGVLPIRITLPFTARAGTRKVPVTVNNGGNASLIGQIGPSLLGQLEIYSTAGFTLTSGDEWCLSFSYVAD